MAGKAFSTIYVYRLDYRDLLVYLASSERGAIRVCLRLGSGEDPTIFFRRIYPESMVTASKKRNSGLIDFVESALRGRPVSQRVPLDIRLTPFQQKAYETICLIPYGHTWTYGQVARAMGSPGAARAVGQAMAANPLPLIFP